MITIEEKDDIIMNIMDNMINAANSVHFKRNLKTLDKLSDSYFIYFDRKSKKFSVITPKKYNPNYITAVRIFDYFHRNEYLEFVTNSNTETFRTWLIEAIKQQVSKITINLLTENIVTSDFEYYY